MYNFLQVGYKSGYPTCNMKIDPHKHQEIYSKTDEILGKSVIETHKIEVEEMIS